MLKQETKEAIADSLALAIQDAAYRQSNKLMSIATHYRIRIDTPTGIVSFKFWFTDCPPKGEGWIEMEEV